MKLSRASTYAIHGLCYLAAQAPGRLVPLSEIRRQRNLPGKHLAKIFLGLVRSGHLRSVRGVHGGFALQRPAASINVLEVVRAVEGLQPSGDCPAHPTSSDVAGCCAVQMMVLEVRGQMERIFARTSLAQLAGPPPREHT